MYKINCYLCNADDYRTIFPNSASELELNHNHIAARRGSMNKEYSYNWVRCNRCKLVYANPIPDTKLLEELYTLSDQGGYQEEEENICYTYAKYLKKYKRFIGQRRVALDIGAGRGFFLKVLLDFGFDKVVGIEPSKLACDSASTKIAPFLINKVFNDKDFEVATIDFISCLQTLEHIPYPNKLIESFSKLLSKNGIVFCVAHNFNTIPVKILGPRHPIVNAGHLTLFESSTLVKMFSRYFEVLDLFKVNNRYSLNYWLSLLPMCESLKSFLIKSSSCFGLNRIPLALSLGNIGIIARKL